MINLIVSWQRAQIFQNSRPLFFLLCVSKESLEKFYILQHRLCVKPTCIFLTVNYELEVKSLPIALNNNLSTVVGKGLSQTVLVSRCFSRRNVEGL